MLAMISSQYVIQKFMWNYINTLIFDIKQGHIVLCKSAFFLYLNSFLGGLIA